MNAIRKAVNLGAGLLMLGGLGFCTYSLGTAESRVRQICQEIPPGIPASSLLAFAQEHGLREPKPESAVQFLAERRSVGRWSCRVEIKNGVVTKTELNGAD